MEFASESEDEQNKEEEEEANSMELPAHQKTSPTNYNKYYTVLKLIKTKVH